MLWELPIWLLLWIWCAGLGGAACWLVVRAGGSRFRQPLGSFQLFWLGLATLIGFLQLYSLAFPINGWAWVASFPAVVFGWVSVSPVAWKRLRLRLQRTARRRLIVELIVGAIIALVVADRSMQVVTWWDTQSLHVSQARWAHEFRAPPGLANLYPKLGFDSAESLLAAFCEIGPWQNRAVHVLNGFLLACVLLHWLGAIVRPANTRAAWFARAFRVITSGFLFDKLCSSEVSSLSTDLTMGITALVLVAELFEARADAGLHLVVLLAIAATCTSFKLSGLPLLAMVAPMAIAGWRRVPADRRLRAAAVLATTPALILLGIVLRRIVLTGWWLYPAPFGQLHLSWSVPRDVVTGEYEWIKSWARLPRVDKADVLNRPFLGWFVAWFEGFRRSHEFAWLCFGSLALAARWTSTTARRLLPRAPLAELCAVGGAFVAIVYWFETAPDLRFGGVFFWLFGAAAVAVPLGLVAQSGIAGRALLAMAGAGWIATSGISVSEFSTLTQLVVSAQIFPTHDRVFDAAARPPLVVHVANSGEMCGNAELPCSPREIEHVRWRRPGHLESGFLP